MIAISVMVEVHPEFREQYREAAVRHAANSLSNEKGCVQFTIHSLPDDPNRFFFYEAYTTEKDVKEVHGVAPYLSEFRKVTAPWVKSQEVTVWEKVSL